MSIYIVLRLSITLAFAVLGWELALELSKRVPPEAIPIARGYYLFIMALIGAVVGFVSAPHLTLAPYRALRNRLREVPARSLVMGIIGLVVGLIIAALLSLPLSLLPGVLGQALPFATAVAFGLLGAAVTIMRDREISSILGLFVARDAVRRKPLAVLLDTSVIIDGRIADISRTGFIPGTMIVPRFVLSELQHIADSANDLRRNRGRRGLEILGTLQKDESVSLEISEADVADAYGVDGKLVMLAQELDCPILTNDYNLNRVASLQGIRVLNINELANAVKAVVLPGETLRVQIIQEGTEPGQGVGYLDDGTMVVVENGRRHIKSAVEIEVTRVLQTVAGRMIFGHLPSSRR